MKSVLFIFLIMATSLILKAQISNPDIEFQKMEFSNDLKIDSAIYFSISPKFKTDTSFLNLKSFEKLPKKHYTYKNRNSNPLMNSKVPIEFRMPIAGSSYSMNMPVMVPDTSVHFYLKEKRIQIVNPGEKESK